MEFETWKKYTWETFGSRGTRLTALDKALQGYHKAFNEAARVDRRSAQWEGAKIKLMVATTDLNVAYHEYVAHKAAKHGESLGSRNNKMSERYSDDYAAKNQSYSGKAIATEKAAKQATLNAMPVSDKLSYKWNKFFGNYNKINGGDGVITRLGKQLAFECDRVMMGYWDDEGDASLLERLARGRAELVGKAFPAGAQLDVKTTAKLRDLRRGINIAPPSNLTTKMVGNQGGSFNELFSSVKELLGGLLKPDPGDAVMSPALMTVITEMIGKAAADLAGHLFPFLGTFKAAGQLAGASMEFKNKLNTVSNVKEAQIFLVDSGDIGTAMVGLQTGLKAAATDAGAEVGAKAASFAGALVGSLAPGFGHIAQLAIGVATAVGSVVYKVRKAIEGARAAANANAILRNTKTLADGGAKDLFETFPLAGAYVISVATVRDLLVSFADVEGSIDAVPIIKRMKKYHIGPVKDAARELITASDFLVNPLPKWQAKDDETGFFASVEKLQDAAEALRDAAVERVENKIGDRMSG